ncbi:MAG TPA: hypothetical protein PK530_24520 [Anaerolineales bacterium]|nr:hypothetical protein [Anaerolineales bacterium]
MICRNCRSWQKGDMYLDNAMGTNLVLLDPDVSRAFPTAEAVNQALRLVIQLTQIPVENSEETAPT